VNNLPKVVALKREAGDRTRALLICMSNALYLQATNIRRVRQTSLSTSVFEVPGKNEAKI